MVKYRSSKPTKEKREMFNFMERHKVGGTVSAKKLGKYIEHKGYKLEARGSKQGESSFGVLNKRGTEIMRAGVKKRVRMWFID